MGRALRVGASNRAVFLDRDGVINAGMVRDGKPYPPDSLEDFRLLPGVNDAVVNLHEAGFKLIIVTNQPDVRTGKQKKSIVEAMHRRLLRDLPIDDIRTCYHINEDDCTCRKPKPGMLLEAAEQWNIDLFGSFMVGDRWRDIEAGQAAGCATVFINYGYSEKQPDQPDFVTPSLAGSIPFILSSISKQDEQ